MNCLHMPFAYPKLPVDMFLGERIKVQKTLFLFLEYDCSLAVISDHHYSCFFPLYYVLYP